MSISVKRMKKLLKDDYQIIDIRSAAEIAHGEIPGAVFYSRKVTMHKVLKVDLGHGFLIK